MTMRSTTRPSSGKWGARPRSMTPLTMDTTFSVSFGSPSSLHEPSRSWSLLNQGGNICTGLPGIWFQSGPAESKASPSDHCATFSGVGTMPSSPASW